MRVQIRLSGLETFDKVWSAGLVCNLNKLGTSGSLLKLRRSYLNVQFQRTWLHVQNSERKPVKAIVPLRPFLGPGDLFLV